MQYNDAVNRFILDGAVKYNGKLYSVFRLASCVRIPCVGGNYGFSKKI